MFFITRFTTAMTAIAIMLTGSSSCNAEKPEIQFAVPDLVYSVDLSADGSLVAAGSRGDGPGTLRVFDVAEKIERWNGDAGRWVWDIAFSPDGKWLVSGSDSGLLVWDVRGGRAPMALPPPQSSLPEVKHLELSSNGNYLAASRGSKIELWDFPRRKLFRVIQTTGGGAVAFSPDEQTLAVGGYHNRLSVFDVSTGKKRGETHAMIGVLVAARFSPDGRMVVVCSEGVAKSFSVIRDGEAVRLTELSRFRGGLGIDISSDGKWVASGGYTGKVHLYGPQGRHVSEPLVVGGDRDSIWDVQFTQDGSKLVTGGMISGGPERGGAVQVWNVSALSKTSE